MIDRILGEPPARESPGRDEEGRDPDDAGRDEVELASFARHARAGVDADQASSPFAVRRSSSARVTASSWARFFSWSVSFESRTA